MKRITEPPVMSEARDLRTAYNRVLIEKLHFAEKVLNQKMHPEQKAEANLRLCMLTGELKRIDAAIQHMVFGGEDYKLETNCMSFATIAKKKVKDTTLSLQKFVEWQEERIKTLQAQNRSATSSRNMATYLYKKLLKQNEKTKLSNAGKRK